jgi:hypothetical protein
MCSLRKGQAYGSEAGAKVGLLHRFILGLFANRGNERHPSRVSSADSNHHAVRQAIRGSKSKERGFKICRGIVRNQTEVRLDPRSDANALGELRFYAPIRLLGTKFVSRQSGEATPLHSTVSRTIFGLVFALLRLV